MVTIVAEHETIFWTAAVFLLELLYQALQRVLLLLIGAILLLALGFRDEVQFVIRTAEVILIHY